ncbi:MAG TPA: response regulator, partial [Vicinamibacterales bacterium]|nr:response regulator [Vicinamibacterales bacterium]
AGIATAQEFAPTIALLDIGMPGMNGYDVARALRSSLPHCVAVAVTGWGHDAAKRQSREAGFAHHLVKPVSESDLIKVLAEIARVRGVK